MASILRKLVVLLTAMLCCSGAADRNSAADLLTLARHIDPRLGASTWNKLDDASQQRFVANDVQEYLVTFDLDRGASAHGRMLLPAKINALRQDLFARLPAADISWRREYRNIPVAKIRLKNKRRLFDLLADQTVVSVSQDEPLVLALTQSLPVISQPQAAAGGVLGNGVSIAVVDTEIDYTRAPFGCSAPGVPETCRISHIENIAEAGDAFSSHGTTVAGIAASVAPGSKIIGLDVKSPGGILTSDIIEAIDWILAHKDDFSIKVANFSLGSTSTFSAPCDSPLNPLYIAFFYLRAGGILPVVASGNGSAANGISSPACFSPAWSVGATFDQDYASHSGCGGASVARDQVACFSNSAYFLDMLAPGSFINAAGSQGSGTSMAAPHVAGAAALLWSRWPELSLNEVTARLADSSADILDTRNGYTFPRLDLSRALLPSNDNFANAKPLNIAQPLSETTVFASIETGEGGAIATSLWYVFTAVDSVHRITLSGNSSVFAKIYGGSGGISQLTLVQTLNPGQEVLTSLQPGVQYYVQIASAGSGGLFQFNVNYHRDENIPLLPAWAFWSLAGIFGAALSRTKRTAHPAM